MTGEVTTTTDHPVEKKEDGADDDGEDGEEAEVGREGNENENENDDAAADEDEMDEEQTMLDEVGGDILRKIGGARFFGENAARPVPTFDKSELGFGRKLGEGSFCYASEIVAIILRRSEPQPTSTSTSGDKKERAPSPSSSPFPEHHDTVAELSNTNVTDRDQHDNHYDMSPSEARTFMEHHYLRGSDARYAVKRLKSYDTLSSQDRMKGRLDLAIECRFLSVVNHPNIVKMRGMACGDALGMGFFLVLDRLYDTLEERVYKWEDRRRGMKKCLGCLVDRMEENMLLLERITVAYDIASVFRYLHYHELIYRDIKPDNMGFDVRDDIKVFDFGLCKPLSPDERSTENTDLYKMSGLTGCLDFMAPEVMLNKPYNLKADVYSFGILLWEIMSLRIPYEDLADLEEEDMIERVAGGGVRPAIDPKWPVPIRALIQDCWSEDIGRRPDFDQIASLLKSTLMTENVAGMGKGGGGNSSAVMNRTDHMKDRSQHSFRGISGSPSR